MAQRKQDTLLGLPETKEMHNKLLRKELNDLLAEAHTLREAEKRLKEIKARILEIVLEESLVGGDGTPGARNGMFGVTIRWAQGRETLSRELLVEAGVTPAQIMAGMKRGNDYQVVELQEIGE